MQVPVPPLTFAGLTAALRAARGTTTHRPVETRLVELLIAERLTAVLAIVASVPMLG
jgi:hypothetical protein